MDLIWLEDFLAIAEDGGFSRAAERRHVTQPALSRRIRALEDWLGAPLFERMTLTLSGGKKLVITAKGSSGSLRVDGVAFAKPVISHAELLKAGRMEFS